ncbi:MAG: hypothetical protein JNL30_17380 [Rubrivivax sp.]|nr:hypothetical protein [Rubrivivax sp.]
MRHVVAALLLAWVTPATANVLWRCTLADDLVRLHCVAAPAERRETVAAEAPSAAEPTAQVRGTRFPLDPQRRWTVDLWSPPTEPGFVELLARSTICHRTPRCSVQVDLGALQRRGF